jgi:hypothetical protein
MTAWVVAVSGGAGERGAVRADWEAETDAVGTETVVVGEVEVAEGVGEGEFLPQFVNRSGSSNKAAEKRGLKWERRMANPLRGVSWEKGISMLQKRFEVVKTSGQAIRSQCVIMTKSSQKENVL